MKKHIVILGAGESGVGAALLAKAKGFGTFVSDQGAIAQNYKDILEKNNIEFEEGKHTEALIFNAMEVVKSPGIPDSAEVIVKLSARGIPVISEIEFAGRYTNARYIAITGTNGKTTTTLLTYHLIKKAGFKVGLAGNIGESLAKQVIDNQFDWYVLELSSFQLDGMFDFKVDVGILLNITPDHMDRYNYKMENYINSKFRITQKTTVTDHFIYYADSEILSKEINKRELKAQLHPISLSTSLESGAYFKNEAINITLKNDSFSIPVDKIVLKGKHNIINSMAAALAAKIVGVDDKVLKEGLQDFVNAPHRLEPVATINGVKFINDSKATNIDSVSYALDAFEEKLIWIAGGIDKGNDYDLIKEMAIKKVKTLICLGIDNSKLIKAFNGQIKTIIDTKNIKDAVAEAFKAAAPGDIVLLSPACASFDLFKNYEDRGKQFKKIVKSLAINHDQ
ncbi:MAG: UDP-N-acetylmuramoyl-L-alanine--D-glutamate ligase [Bacteroidota bacterium]|nr:UDP-N-acetylmuramoyl-L-alanine--D-glutamate ligase [Bacteroidota bacterium]